MTAVIAQSVVTSLKKIRKIILQRYSSPICDQGERRVPAAFSHCISMSSFISKISPHILLGVRMPFPPTLTHSPETEFLLISTSYQDCMLNYSVTNLLSSSNAYYCIKQGGYLAAIFLLNRYRHVAMLFFVNTTYLPVATPNLKVKGNVFIFPSIYLKTIGLLSSCMSLKQILSSTQPFSLRWLKKLRCYISLQSRNIRQTFWKKNLEVV